MKSRPAYTILTPRPGCLHVVVSDREGGEAVLDLVRRAPAGFLDRCHVLQVVGPGERMPPAMPKSAIHEPHADAEAATARLADILSGAFMGTQLYLAGTEGLIGRATQVALESGMELASIQAEHRGSRARRVQCVHCKGITEDVRTQPCICAHCGLTLFVRDHYSRRMAAFQGVRIDAEEPGAAPAAVESFR